MSGLVAALSVARTGDEAAAKKRNGKRKRKKKKTQPPPSPPAVTRQMVTQTFFNTSAIFIPGTGTGGLANPFPSTIEVSGLTNGVIIDVDLLLYRFGHIVPFDVDVLLAASQIPGRNAIVMSDVGGASPVFNVDLVLDDQAAAGLPENGPLVSGAFWPTNFGASDGFSAPAPAPTGNSALSTFNGQNPNGTWQLFVIDDATGDSGSFDGGWAIQITAEVDV